MQLSVRHFETHVRVQLAKKLEGWFFIDSFLYLLTAFFGRTEAWIAIIVLKRDEMPHDEVAFTGLILSSCEHYDTTSCPSLRET